MFYINKIWAVETLFLEEFMDSDLDKALVLSKILAALALKTFALIKDSGKLSIHFDTTIFSLVDRFLLAIFH